MSAPEFIRPDWPAPANVRAATTTRIGGVSNAPFDSFNVGDHVDDDPAAVEANRALLVDRLGLPGAPLWLQQVHGTRVLRGEGVGTENVADACWSDRVGDVCAVMTADCLPVLFCDRDGTAVAAAHAGWRGLQAGILENTLTAMPVSARDVLVWMGPAIGPQAFEVGDEVRQAFCDEDAGAASAFTTSERDGHWMADLYALAKRRLMSAGVHSINGGDLCTLSDSRRFYSYRRDGRTGRMVTVVWLAEEL